MIKRRIPRVSTRGYYDLQTGKTLKKQNYFLYPKSFFENFDSKELVIMIHGLRNDNASAVTKFEIAKKRLVELRYKYPVIGFSYDANTKGAHIKKCERKALNTGKLIARKNGKNLSQFIIDFKRANPSAKIRLMGHSLGSNVIQSTVSFLANRNFKGILTAIYIFGASIPHNSFSKSYGGKNYQKVVQQKIINYYSPYDEVLQQGVKDGLISPPLGLTGAQGQTIPKYSQRKVKPENHRFASYAKVLRKFP